LFYKFSIDFSSLHTVEQDISTFHVRSYDEMFRPDSDLNMGNNIMRFLIHEMKVRLIT
ncbi:hypothetical protein L9F63_016188, partial [Diploptera punctata]